MSALAAWARALGGEVSGGQILAPGPGHSAHDRSMAVWPDAADRDGFRVHSFAGDDWRKCRDYVKARLGLGDFRSAAPHARPIARKAKPEPRRADDGGNSGRALAIWAEARDPRGTVVEAYLASRGLGLPPNAAESIGFHPACAFKLKTGELIRMPTMICLMRNIVSNAPQAIHRTALRPDGSGKAELPGGKGGGARRMLGPAAGCAIKLSPDETVTDGLGICEGIETGLAVIGTGWRPVWALGSCTGITAFPVLSGVEALTIFADHDIAGLAPARDCQRRWADVGRECRIVHPCADGFDWNDIIRERVP